MSPQTARTSPSRLGPARPPQSLRGPLQELRIGARVRAPNYLHVQWVEPTGGGRDRRAPKHDAHRVTKARTVAPYGRAVQRSLRVTRSGLLQVERAPHARCAGRAAEEVRD